jgi:hypothetical protein
MYLRFIVVNLGSGDKEDHEDESFLERMTLISIFDNSSKMGLVFPFIILYSIFGHVFIYYISKHANELKEKQRKLTEKSEEKKKLSEETLAMHTVMIKGLNTKFSVKTL